LPFHVFDPARKPTAEQALATDELVGGRALVPEAIPGRRERAGETRDDPALVAASQVPRGHARGKEKQKGQPGAPETVLKTLPVRRAT